jgi:hypothetical protein
LSVAVITPITVGVLGGNGLLGSPPVADASHE